MRELKFRAWDKIGKRWLHPYPHGFAILGETTCFDMLMNQMCEAYPGRPTLEMLNDVEIVQFTGLRDKKGVEIYEGDIIEGMGFMPVGSKIQVVFNSVLAQVVGSLDNEKVYWFNHELDRISVIGNIYENAETQEVAA